LAYVLEIYVGEKKISFTVNSSQQNYGILDFRKRDLFENQFDTSFCTYSLSKEAVRNKELYVKNTAGILVWKPVWHFFLYLQLEQGGSEEQGALREEHGWDPGREGYLPHHLLQLDQGLDYVFKQINSSGIFIGSGFVTECHGSGFGSFSFRQWFSRCQLKNKLFY
jgi:hypothetical protein